MYKQYFLKFDSEEQFYQVFEELGWYSQKENKIILDSNIGSIDIIGMIINDANLYDDTEIVREPESYLDDLINSLIPIPLPDDPESVIENPEDYNIPPAQEIEYLEGWHVNIVINIPLPNLLNIFLVFPSTPHRIFAGFES